jgi:hypothetical protein
MVRASHLTQPLRKLAAEPAIGLADPRDGVQQRPQPVTRIFGEARVDVKADGQAHATVRRVDNDRVRPLRRPRLLRQRPWRHLPVVAQDRAFRAHQRDTVVVESARFRWCRCLTVLFRASDVFVIITGYVLHDCTFQVRHGDVHRQPSRQGGEELHRGAVGRLRMRLWVQPVAEHERTIRNVPHGLEVLARVSLNRGLGQHDELRALRGRLLHQRNDARDVGCRVPEYARHLHRSHHHLTRHVVSRWCGGHVSFRLRVEPRISF